MCTASAAKRRRKQAVKNYRHLAPLNRPKYSKPSDLKMSDNRKGRK